MKFEIINADVNSTADIFKIENVCFSSPWSKSSINESLNNPNSYYYLAYAGSKLAGYMGLQIFSGEGYVTNIAILPEFRRKGAAKSLLKKALENKMEFITLEVRESNFPAISLYKSFGFKEVGVRPDYYSNPDESAVLMTKYLK